MKRILVCAGFMLGLFMSFSTAQAQLANPPIRYGIRLDPNGTTYRVYMTSTTALSGNGARIASAQVTIRVPHRTGADRFTFNNVQGRVVGASQMSWSSALGRVDAPRAPTSSDPELPYDYVSFGFLFSNSPVLFDIPANVELELFSFDRTSPCIGEVTLFENNTDPFRTPNTLNTNPGNQITIQALGANNAYIANIGGPANCQVPAPDLTIAITGPATLTAGTPGSYSISANNIGNATTSGVVSLTTILPAGLSYLGSTGAAWSCASTTLGNGNVQVVCTSSTPISASGSSGYAIQVTAAPGLTAATLSATIFGAGESNYGNNTATKSITIQAPVVTPPTGATANLSTTVQVTNSAPNQFEATTAVIVVTNSGPNSATGVTSQVTLPVGNPITSVAVTGGTFNQTTGQWTIGTITPGQSVTLTLTFSAATGGIANVSNEITASGQFDPNSTPNNQAEGEDDQARACFSVPFDLCSGSTLLASTPDGLTNIQWKRNGQNIPNANSSTLLITQSGTYTVESNGSCPTGSCCPLIVRDAVNCCPTAVCLPITIRRTR